MEHHAMKLESRNGNVSTYYCPECGRKISVDYETGQRVVLKEGTADQATTSHSGSEGGLVIGVLVVQQDPPYRWN